MDAWPQRKRPAHVPPLDVRNRATIVLVTVCTAQRRPLLANQAAHKHLRSVWNSATAWLVGRYVLMPDHLHFFCSPGEAAPPPLRRWVTFWKSRAAATWPWSGETPGPVWQRDCWDTQLRVGDSYGLKWDYVRNNPVRAGFVAAPEAWEFQGELNVLWWQE